MTVVPHPPDWISLCWIFGCHPPDWLVIKLTFDFIPCFFDKSAYNNIIIHEGRAIDNLEMLPPYKFDFAFIDADKVNYIEYYKRCMILIRKGGIIVLDNMLWSGKVLNPDDEDSTALNNTAKFINEDKKVFSKNFPTKPPLSLIDNQKEFGWKIEKNNAPNKEYKIIKK